MKGHRNTGRARARAPLSIAIILLAMSWTGAGAAEVAAKPVDGERIANADAEPGNWLTYGRTYSEQRFSPLTRNQR